MGRAWQGVAAGAGARGAGLAGRQARGLGAGRAAWARGLALCCALGALGLFSIRFDSVLFMSQFWTLFVNPVHEHCSSRNFSKKIIF